MILLTPDFFRIWDFFGIWVLGFGIWVLLTAPYPGPRIATQPRPFLPVPCLPGLAGALAIIVTYIVSA
jgi:hypothetical protein